MVADEVCRFMVRGGLRMKHPETEIAARIVERAVVEKINRIERRIGGVPENRKYASRAEAILDEARRIREAGSMIMRMIEEMDALGGAA